MPVKPKRRKGKRRHKRISVKKLEKTRSDLMLLFNFARTTHFLGFKSGSKAAITAFHTVETIDSILLYNKNRFYVVL